MQNPANILIRTWGESQSDHEFKHWPPHTTGWLRPPAANSKLRGFCSRGLFYLRRAIKYKWRATRNPFEMRLERMYLSLVLDSVSTFCHGNWLGSTPKLTNTLTQQFSSSFEWTYHIWFSKIFRLSLSVPYLSHSPWFISVLPYSSLPFLFFLPLNLTLSRKLSFILLFFFHSRYFLFPFLLISCNSLHSFEPLIPSFLTQKRNFSFHYE
jgi:hypothetical protein